MEVVLKLFLISLMPICASIGIRAIQKYTKFKHSNDFVQQLFIGVVFGIVSILGTVFGIQTTSGAIINVRDVPPMCAGFIFGGPAGIIAGIIGGGYRFISVYFGLSGAYTQLACSISTVCAGIFAAIIRKVVFNDHHGKWYYGLGLGVLCESFHMLMVFFTHMGDIETAYNTVINCAGPMILVNSLAVMFSLIGVALVSKEKLIERYRPMKVSSIIQIGLLISICIAFFVTTLFINRALKNISDTSTTQLLQTNVKDLQDEVEDQIDRKTFELTENIVETVEEKIKSGMNVDSIMSYIRQRYDVTEVSYIGYDGVITHSTDPAIIGYNMNDGEQSIEFNVLLNDSEYYVQQYQPRTLDNKYMKYAGGKIHSAELDIAYIQIGYDTIDYHRVLETVIQYTAVNRTVGNKGYMMVCDYNGDVLSKNEDSIIIGKKIDVDKIELNKKLEHLIVNGDLSEEVYYYAVSVEGYYIVAWANKDSCDLDTNIAFLATALTEAFVFLLMYCVIYVIIKRFVVDSVENINKSLNKISDGDLNVVVSDRRTDEFNSLSDDINKTVDTLKGFIEREAKKIDEELKFAKNIQESSLPKHFPAFPNIKNVDLYAMMKTAKEVGGDFYDFYKLPDNRVAILIADVSGKGIPAAMFMMKAKSIIKSLAENGLSVNEVVTEANKRLCEENDAGMFVTAWLAFIDYTNGHVEFTNAGHNSPLVCLDGEYTYLKSKAGFVLGGMDTIIYKKNEFDLKENDVIYLYTDGVTEAMNTEKKLYGEDRLENLLNKLNTIDPKVICDEVLKDVEEYTNGEPQSDDITMLTFTYLKEE